MRTDVGNAIITQAKSLGAHLAGIAPLADVNQAPSSQIRDRLPAFDGVGTLPGTRYIPRAAPWPPEARSVIVIAMAHPLDTPELDWWITGSGSGNTAGNRLLMDVVDRLAAWLEEEEQIRSVRLPYHIEKGGVYLKDAAVMAGLGCIGKNNLLISPQFGPRLRLRAMLIDAQLPASGPSDYDPCRKCPMPCLHACPQQAFARTLYAPRDFGVDALPGRSGTYDRWRCNRQMEADESKARTQFSKGRGTKATPVKYCRACEWACPVGNR